MNGQISYGGQGVKPQAFGNGDVTVTEVYVTRSEYDQPKKGGGERPAYQLALRMKNDQGVETTGFYGGLYPNFVPGATDVAKKQRVNPATVSSFGIGQGGFARQFIAAWETALGKQASSIFDLMGSRFYAEVVSQNAGGKQSIKLFPKGAPRAAAPIAQNVPNVPIAPPVNAAAAFAALAQPAPRDIDGAAHFNALDAGTQNLIKQTLKSATPEAVAKTLVETRLCPDLATATAVAQHAKGVQ